MKRVRLPPPDQIRKRSGGPLAKLVLFSAFLLFFSMRHSWYSVPWLTIETAPNAPQLFEISWSPDSGGSRWESIRTDYDSTWLIRTARATAGMEPQVRLFLPQRPVKRLRISSEDPRAISGIVRAWISTDGAGCDQLFPIFQKPPLPTSVNLDLDAHKGASGFSFDDLNLHNRRFTLTLWLLQVLAASIATWATLWVVRGWKRAGRVADLLWTGERKILTLFFISSTSIFTLWLIGQWPAGMMQDSFWCYDQSIGMWFDSWHPPFYYFYLIVLRQFWDSPAAVTIFQLLSTSLLASLIFYYAVCRGARLIFVLPFFVLFVLSIPVGLMNVWITKDVPSSIATVALAFWMFHKRLTRVSTGAFERISYLPPLLLLIACAAELRYTGVIWYLILPLTLWYVIDWRDYLKIMAFLVVLYAGAHVWIPKHIPTQWITEEFGVLLNPPLGIMRDPGHFTPNPTADRAFLERFLPVDEAIRRFDPASVDPVRTDLVRYAQMGPADVSAFRRFALRLVLDNLPKALADRTEMITSASGVSHHAQLYFDLLPHFGSWKRYYSPNLYNLSKTPLSTGLYTNENILIETVSSPGGFWRWRTVVWDLFLPIGLAFAVLVAKPADSPHWLYVLPTLMLLGLLFVVMPGANWRYLYSVYLSSFFVAPLCLVPLRTGNQGSMKMRPAPEPS